MIAQPQVFIPVTSLTRSGIGSVLGYLAEASVNLFWRNTTFYVANSVYTFSIRYTKYNQTYDKTSETTENTNRPTGTLGIQLSDLKQLC